MADSQSIQLLDVTVLQPNPFQPRNKIMKEDLEELSESIRRYGILEPLLIAHTPAGYQIIAGERRWRAAQLAGLTEIPAIIRKCSPREMLEMALIENVQRVDLSPLERAHSFQQLHREFGFSVSEIADKISKSSAFVSNTMRLLTLPDAIKDGLVGGLITEGHARALAGLEDKQAMIEAYKQILRENASVRRAEMIVRKFKHALGQKRTATQRMVYQADDKEIKAWEARLKKLIQVRTKIRLSRSDRQTRITITLHGRPEETQSDLEKIIRLTGGTATIS
jgi:ParB family chromosome partitioning protein